MCIVNGGKHPTGLPRSESNGFMNLEHDRRPNFMRLWSTVDFNMSNAAAIDFSVVRFFRGISICAVGEG